MLFAWYYVAIFVSVVSIVMTFMCEVQSGVKRLSGKEKKQHTAADFFESSQALAAYSATWLDILKKIRLIKEVFCKKKNMRIKYEFTILLLVLFQSANGRALKRVVPPVHTAHSHQSDTR